MIKKVVRYLQSSYKQIQYGRKLDANRYILEIHIVDHCNLNCKGCSHYSPIADEWYISLADYEAQIKTAAAVFSGNIREFHILGGEPLLHPEINSIIRITRKYFQKDKIAILSNGLLVKKMDEFFWDAVRKHNIILSLTRYPCVKNFDSLMEYARLKNVEVRSISTKNTFYFYGMNEKGEYNSDNAYYNCTNGGYCLQIRNGKIYPCNAIAYIDIVNRKFGTNFTVDEKSYLELDSVKSSKEVLRFRRTAKRVCRYCNVEERKSFLWDYSNCERQEWIIDE